MSKGRVALIAILLLLLGGSLPIAFSPAAAPIREWLARIIHGSGSEADPHAVVATLAARENQVKHRNRDALDWNDAVLDMGLGEGDKVRTADESRATVRFLRGGDDLVVDPQSLITIHVPRAADDPLIAELEVDGTVEAHVSRTGEGKDRFLRIKSDKGETLAEVSTVGSKEGFADVSVVVRPNKPSRIVVHRGSGRVSAGGKALDLTAGQEALSDKKAGTLVSQTAQLLPAPRTVSPPDGAVNNSVGSPSIVAIVWEQVPGARHYKLEVSTDASFAKGKSAANATVPSERASFEFAPEFFGKYWWRVLALDSSDVPGASSDARGFSAAETSATPTPTATPTPKKRLPPPDLVIRGVAGSPLRVAGIAKKGARKVFVDGREAKISPEGQYEIELTNLKPGKKIIVVESMFEDGSIQYEKRPAEIAEKK